jgi:hypothetical protein
VYGAGKKEAKGTKRHLIVDTQGLLLKAKVHPANVLFERDGIKWSSRSVDDPEFRI